MLADDLRTKLATRPVVGCFSKATDPAFVEATGLAGMDFVILDREHGPADLKTVEHLVRAAECGGVAPIVRVPAVDEHAIGAALDLGTAGVQVPNVSTADDARRIRAAARFHPEGARGVCRYVRAAAYSSREKAEYFREANRSLVIGQVEGREGLANLDAILAEDAFDVLFVGPYDLSQAMGRPGEVDNPEVTKESERVVKLSAARGVACGTFLDSAEEAERWTAAGVRYLAVSVDVGIFLDACRRIVGRAR
ncbi:MAG: HpcH/HpaI aldolase family protein [Planctomycetota bacterium]|jgi:4-hydroxy-2-oxoheptanedioate aldolase